MERSVAEILRPVPDSARSFFEDPTIPLLDKVETYLTIAQFMEEEDRVKLQEKVFPRLLEWADLRRRYKGQNPSDATGSAL